MTSHASRLRFTLETSVSRARLSLTNSTDNINHACICVPSRFTCPGMSAFHFSNRNCAYLSVFRITSGSIQLSANRKQLALVSMQTLILPETDSLSMSAQMAEQTSLIQSRGTRPRPTRTNVSTKTTIEWRGSF